MKCYKGNILTINKNNDVCKFLVEDQGNIVFVGNELPDEYKNIEIIDLGEKALIPSFCDSHQHFASFATFYTGLNIMDAKSNIEIKELIKTFVEQNKSKLYIAFGASPYSVEEKCLLTKQDLDEVCPNKPICVVKYDGHACIVNSKLLKKIDKKVRNLRGYHYETGEMNQEAFFAVSDAISSSLSIPQLIKAMQKAIDFLAEKGIGMVHSVSGIGFPFNMDITLEKLFAKSVQNGIQVRIFPQSLNVKVSSSREIPRIGGCFESALDGCFGSQDAALNEPYLSSLNDKGVLYYEDEKVINFLKEANRKGLQIEIHAIGDRAFDQATKCLKTVLDDFPRNDHRHGIIHSCLPTKEGIDICSKYKIQLPVQSAFIGWKQEPDEYLESILGKTRADKLNPLRTFLDNGIVLSFGSDGPCTTPDPIDWLYKACNHSNSNESISIKEALRIATFNGYWATFDEKDRGSLEVGKIANMVILSENPYEIDVKDIKNIKVLKSIYSGKEYKKQDQSIFKILAKGLFGKGNY